MTKEVTFKSSTNNKQPINIEGQIKYLIKDLLEFYKTDYKLGWPKLVQLFLLGYTMESYYTNIISKISNKNKKRKNNEDENLLIKYFKFKDYEIIIEKIKNFRKTRLGENIVTLNLNEGSKILKAVLECAEQLKINNKNFQDGLIYLKDNYMLQRLTNINKENNNRN